MDARRIALEIRKTGSKDGNPKLQAYLGSPYKVLGLSGPQIGGIVREFAKSNKELEVSELNTIANHLWSKGKTYDEKAVTISLLDRYSKILDEQTWKMTDRWIEQAIGWALCDSLGSGPISSMLYSDESGNKFKEVLDWTESQNFWRRRIALYALRDFVFAGELDKPLVLLKKLLYDKEFWVQRAVGTWLRECWKKDKKRTEAFLNSNSKGLPKVVITVATERAPKSFRERLRRLRV